MYLIAEAERMLSSLHTCCSVAEIYHPDLFFEKIIFVNRRIRILTLWLWFTWYLGFRHIDYLTVLWRGGQCRHNSAPFTSLIRAPKLVMNGSWLCFKDKIKWPPPTSVTLGTETASDMPNVDIQKLFLYIDMHLFWMLAASWCAAARRASWWVVFKQGAIVSNRDTPTLLYDIQLTRQLARSNQCLLHLLDWS